MPLPFTIGVFDSGFGGLTVLRELLNVLPGARFVYLGDSARLPYGSKSRDTITQYAVSSAAFLLRQGAQLLVIACNTATALALPEIQATAAPTPVLGVIEPGAQAAVALSSVSSKPEHVLVLATPATVSSHAYALALEQAGLVATEKACPLLVPLVEEGWTDHPVTEEVARIYLTEAFKRAPSTSSVLLGCTHYPLLKPLLARTLARLGRSLPLIDSAQTTAQATLALLGREHADLLENLQQPAPANLQVFATDSVEKFQQLGSRFLGQPLPPVQLVHLSE